MSGFISPTQKVSDVADVVKRAFGDESGVQITENDIYRWVNMAQRELLITNQVNKAFATTDIISGQTDYSLNALKILKIVSLHVNNKHIPFKNWPEAQEYIIKQDPTFVQTGEPYIWYEWGGVIKLYPVPDKTYTNGLDIYYLKDFTAVASLTDFLTIPDEYFNRIVEYVLAQAYEMDEDIQQSQLKMQQFTQGLSTMNDKENQVELNTYPVITILPEDTWWD